VLSFAPWVQARHKVKHSSSSPSENTSDDYVDSAGMGEMKSMHYTDEEDEKFYDACTDPEMCVRDDFQTAVVKEEVVTGDLPLHTEIATAAASEWFEPCSNSTDCAKVSESPSHAAGGSQASRILVDVVDEAHDSCFVLSCPKELSKEITVLPVEKLKLLQKMMKNRHICEQCKVMVDLECKTVVLTGPEDDVEDTELAIFVALASAGQRSVNISKELGHLLSTQRGQEWFDGGCSRYLFSGICHLQNSVTMLLAVDDTVADAMQKWLMGELLSERISLEAYQLSFFQTSQWMDFIRELTGSQLLLIHVDSSDMEIHVEGLTDAVKSAVKRVGDLLARMCHKSEKLQLTPADFETLSFFKLDIHNKMQDLATQQER